MCVGIDDYSCQSCIAKDPFRSEQWRTNEVAVHVHFCLYLVQHITNYITNKFYMVGIHEEDVWRTESLPTSSCQFCNGLCPAKSLLLIVMVPCRLKWCMYGGCCVWRFTNYLKDRPLHQKYASAYAFCGGPGDGHCCGSKNLRAFRLFLHFVAIASILECHLVLFGVQEVSWMFEQFENLSYDCHTNTHCE